MFSDKSILNFLIHESQFFPWNLKFALINKDTSKLGIIWLSNLLIQAALLSTRVDFLS